MIYVLICISLIICIIGFVIVTIDYMKTRNIYDNLSKEEYKKLKEKEKERDDYYGLFH